MEKGFERIYGAISRRLLRTVDAIIDQRICGQNLVKYVPSVYRDDANGVGMTGQHRQKKDRGIEGEFAVLPGCITLPVIIIHTGIYFVSRGCAS